MCLCVSVCNVGLIRRRRRQGINKWPVDADLELSDQLFALKEVSGSLVPDLPLHTAENISKVTRNGFHSQVEYTKSLFYVTRHQYKKKRWIYIQENVNVTQKTVLPQCLGGCQQVAMWLP